MVNASQVFQFAPSDSASTIQTALDAYMAGKTVINVTHNNVRGMQVYTVFTS